MTQRAQVTAACGTGLVLLAGWYALEQNYPDAAFAWFVGWHYLRDLLPLDDPS